MYVKALAILLLIGGAFFFGRSTGIDSERSKRTETAEATVEAKTQTENVIIQEKVVWRDRIQKVREVVVDCELPADLISVLRESRVFTAGEVRDANHN
jgi:hypothetical protein